VPEAWSGLTSMIGSDPMPGRDDRWDGAGWTGRARVGPGPCRWGERQVSGGVLAGTLVGVTSMAEMGRGMGVFAPEVLIDAEAPLLDRIVASTGRDPSW